jgi:HlyD family secretion protein
MKKAKRIRAAALVAVLIAAGLGIYFRLRPDPDGAGTIALYGNVDIRQARLAFHSTGRVQRLHVREGDPVKTGQLLAELDASRYAAAADRAAAEMAAQQEVAARLAAGSRPEEIAEAKARVQAAQAALRDAEQRQRRTSALAADDYVSKQQSDDAQNAVDAARANLEALQQSAALVELGPRKELIAEANSRLRALQAARALAAQELADTKLYAPTNGIIQNRVLEVGDMAAPQIPAMTLALNDPVWVRAYVPEPDLGRLKDGIQVTVTTDSFPDRRYEGWIGYISPTAEFTPKQVETTDLRTRLVYQVRVYVRNPAGELRLGMPATVHVPCPPPDDDAPE